MIRAVVGCLLVSGLLHAAEPLVLSGRAMGTGWSVKIVAAPALDRDELVGRIGARLEALEQQFSTYRENSEVTRFNAAAGDDWFPVSPEVAEVARRSQAVSELTGGAFDATVYPLVRLWGFAAQRRNEESLPSAAIIAANRAGVGWRQLAVRSASPALRKMQPALQVDFSSMAKGFAVDEITAWLMRSGVQNCVVQIAGDVKCVGVGPDGKAWKIGIEQPREAGHGLAGTLRLPDRALSTSGDYRNFFVIGGRRYGHIIDPRTGAPAQTGLASVSVVHESCAESSALATGLFVLGPQAGFKLAAREGLAALFIEREGETLRPRATPALERMRPETELSSVARR